MEEKKYSYKEHTYTIVREILMKDTLTREWKLAVLYKSESNAVYAREAKEFYRKFKLIE